MRLGKWFVQPCTKQNCSIDNGWVMHEYDADAYFSLCGKTWLGICWTIHVKHILEIIDCLMARQIPRTNYSNLSQEHFCWAHVKCFRSFSNSFLRTFIIRKIHRTPLLPASIIHFLRALSFLYWSCSIFELSTQLSSHVLFIWIFRARRKYRVYIDRSTKSSECATANARSCERSRPQ